MVEFLRLFVHVLVAPFRTQAQLEAEITMLRHQLNALRRRAPAKPRLTAADRLFFVWLCRLFPPLKSAITIVQPDTVLRWHRSDFRLYWRWKSRSCGGRPKVAIEIHSVIWRMSEENPLWGAPRIHGELLKLGYEIAQSTVAKYMVKRRPGSGQTWKTFLRNHAAGIGAMDFLVVPTINFRLLSVLVILRHERRRLISLSVTDHPTAEWIAQQIPRLSRGTRRRPVSSATATLATAMPSDGVLRRWASGISQRPDGRYVVSAGDPSYLAVGQLIGPMPCTGTAVLHPRIVLTAADCVIERGRATRTLLFRPAYLSGADLGAFEGRVVAVWPGAWSPRPQLPLAPRRG
jgi:hypothetical protein